VPAIIDAGRIEAGQRVLDVGCGTGGFSREIAETTGAAVVGIDVSPDFVEHAAGLAGPRGLLEWVVGEADTLPFADRSFDRILLSLVLHQLDEPERAVAEASRVLADQGLVIVRTIAPEDAADRVPARYLPSVAAADVARMPPLETIERWLERAGFAPPEWRRLLRNKRLDLADEERHMRVEVRSRYPFVTGAELQEGLRRMRNDATHDWVDPRPTYILVAAKR
jgi:SAM-dependent methyltransferase